MKSNLYIAGIHAKSLQSCPTLCDPMDCSPPGSPVHGVGCHFLLQGIFLTQGSNLHFLWLLHCRRILYRLSHQGSPQKATHPIEKQISILLCMYNHGDASRAAYSKLTQTTFIKKTEDAYTEPGLTDPELGLRYCFSFLLPYKKNRSSKIRTKLPAFLLNTEKCNKSILT